MAAGWGIAGGMCVLAFAWNAHPRWKLVLAGNRDEFHARPAAALARWDGPDDLIAGRDLQSGGTWLGVSGRGRLAVVTNLRGYGGPDPDRASRGALVTDMLAGTGDYGDPDNAPLGAFNPFNLIVAGPGQARFLSNRPHDIRAKLAHGVYGLSNGGLDEPWPKLLQIKAFMFDWLTGGADDPHALFDGLRSETLPAIGIAPTAPSDAPREPKDSPIFIRDAVYGTRCSTVVAIDRDGAGLIAERRFTAAGEAAGDSAIRFSWPV